MSFQRPDGRQGDQMRPISFERNFTKFSAGSVLAKCGDTVVLCSVTIQAGVPKFLENTGKGWLTAEYRMLPGATPQRQNRELMQLSGRTQEIQRLIGRSLRACLDLKLLGERTIIVDADVLQADAGTRTTSITGGFVAFTWAQIERIGENILVTTTPETANAQKPEDVVTVLGHELCTDAGKEAGKLVDYLVVSHTGVVLNYLFSSSGWRGVLDGIYVMSPAAIQSFGTKRIIVSEIAALNPELYEEGLHHKIGKAADFAQKDYEKTVDHWENLKQRTQVGTEGLKRGAQQLADELQERAQEMKDKVDDVAEQAKERVTEARSKLKKETPPAAPEIIPATSDDDDF